ncbi:MAG: 4-hydroxy-3-methylbut-2-enyl diphosphate reductase [Spirochaetales bacterium]|jgi:4-hydroxy-3-methylbut-2-enyl diphosphate reductase|nr:4-hydroxy-3-methylbut-2-enyl diphosphate reductase [Spirochaetales bacterium]
MRVITAKYSGFCPGVMQAEKKIFREHGRHADEHIYILGYLIHNQTYIDYLSRYSVITVSDTAQVPEGSVVVVRTHGLQRQTEEELRKKFRVLDLTCPKVKKIQLLIRDYALKGFFVLITGKKDHPEVQGLVSYAEGSDVIEKHADINRFAAGFDASPPQKIFVVSQTTGDPALFTETVRIVGEKAASAGIRLESFNSICSITDMREREALKLQKEVDVTFVIGDRISSNATKLYKILAAGGQSAVFFVNSREEALAAAASERSRSGGLRWKTAQIVSSSSTPAFLEQEIAGCLEEIR